MGASDATIKLSQACYTALKLYLQWKSGKINDMQFNISMQTNNWSSIRTAADGSIDPNWEKGFSDILLKNII